MYGRRKRTPADLAALILLALVITGCGGTSESKRGHDRWNLLVITLDTTRADRLGFHGHDAARTPRLDALAERGFIFDRARSHSPLTLPSHASIFTGLLPTEHGVRNNGTYVLGDSQTTLAETLSSAGYATAAVVAAYVLDRKFGLAQGFDAYDDTIEAPAATQFGYAERTGDVVTRAALALADDFTRDRPYFLWAHYFDPHAPYSAPERFRRGFDDTPLGRYDAEIAAMDHWIGELLDGLDSRGLLDRTLVAIVADHGEGVAGPHDERSHGIFLYPDTLHIPFVFSTGKGKAEALLGATGRSDALVRQIDVMPTVLEWLGVASQSEFEGRSLAPLVRGGSLSAVESYAETFFPLDGFGWSPLFAIESDAWKYIEAPREELYATQVDPLETRNLAGDETDAIEPMRAALAQLRDNATWPYPTAGSRALGAADARRLGALGYATGGGASAIRDWSGLADPKDRIELHEELESTRIDQIEGRFALALTKLDNILDRDPGNFEALGQKASVLAALGRPEQSVAPLRELTQRVPDAAHHHVRLGGVLMELAAERAANGDLDGAAQADGEARDAFARAVEIGTPDIAPYVNLGVICIRAGDFDAAVDALERAVEIDANSYPAWYNLGRAHLLARHLEDAATALDRAAELVDDDVARLRNLRSQRAEVHARLEEYREALTLYNQLLRDHPNDPEAERFRTIVRELERILE